MNNDTAITNAELSAFIHNTQILITTESEIADALKLPIKAATEFVVTYQARLSFVKVPDTTALDVWLSKNTHFIKAFIINWYSGAKQYRRSFLPSGITIGFLCWALAFEQGGFDRLKECVEKCAFTKNVDFTDLAKSFEIAYLKAKGKQI